MKKKKIFEVILDILIVIIIVGLYVFAGMYIYSNFRERKRKEISNNIIKEVEKKVEENKEQEKAVEEVNVTYNNFKYTVLGRIIIKKIGINQPILKENTKKAYDTALVRMNDVSLNSYGNLAIGGHNFMRGNYFIKINRLVNNDVVIIRDLSGNEEKYYVYEYKTTTVDDASYLTQPLDKSEKIVTLVTCTKGGKERYYVKARAK